MHRRRLILASMALALMPVRVAMADYVDDVVVQLEDQGFGSIEVTRTLLGRTRIVASNGNGTRELILNARTGEILRDVWMNSSGQSSPGLANGSEGTSGDDDGDDDNDDHGGNDDNSGHGSDDSGGDDHGGGGDDSGESDDD